MFCCNDSLLEVSNRLVFRTDDWRCYSIYMLNDHLWDSKKAFKRDLFVLLQYTHQNAYIWNLKPYHLWSIGIGGNGRFILFAEGSSSYFCNWIGSSLHLSGPRLRSAEVVWGVSVKRFPLIHFICSAIPQNHLSTQPNVPRWPFPPAPSKDWEWRCKTQTV